VNDQNSIKLTFSIEILFFKITIFLIFNTRNVFNKRKEKKT